MPIMIIYVTIGLLVVSLLIGFIPWRKIGESIFANDPTKAYLYIEFGDEGMDCVEAKYFYSNEKGLKYSYKWRGNDLVVAVPVHYCFRWLHGRRCLRLAHPGDAWASPLGVLSVPKDIQKSAFDLNALVRGHVAVELVRSVYGSSKVSIVVIVIIAIALLAGYFIYQNEGLPGIGSNPPAQQQKVPKPPVIDDVPYQP